jgi:hypothetical protein
MLHMFVMALKYFQVFCKCFRHMLQMFHLDIAKVDMMLHMLQWDPPATSACCSCWGAVVPAQMVPVCMHVGSEGGTSGSYVWGVRHVQSESSGRACMARA